MAKAKQKFICTACGTVHSKWAGQCEGCGSWDTLEEDLGASTAGAHGLKEGTGHVLPFTNLENNATPTARHVSNLPELDRVLGGGFVPGSASLIGGDPGIGKSTLLIQAAAALASEDCPVAYISGEESIEQVQLRAARLGLTNPSNANRNGSSHRNTRSEKRKNVSVGDTTCGSEHHSNEVVHSEKPLYDGVRHIHLAHATSVRDILASLTACKAKLAVIDSIQTMFVDSIPSAPGTVSQVRSASGELIHYAKTHNTAMVLVGHVTKDGQIAGPRVMEHMVDTVLYFEGDRSQQFRILRAVKNRFGATDEIGVFSMEAEGLQGITNPSELFLHQRDSAVSGSAVFPAMEGTRPLLVEIEALIAPSPLATPRRAVVGWDSNRLAMVLAVLETRAGLQFSDKEVYLNVSGGLRVNEPGADAAVAAALISALKDTPTPRGSVYFGEVGLSGEIRPTSHHDQRLKEAEKLGFTAAYFPKNKKSPSTNLATQNISHVRDVVV